MTITAVRLRPFNKKTGMGKKTHTSYHLGKKYSIGAFVGAPSPVYVVNDRTELAELRKIPQFEIMVFTDRKDLDDFLASEIMNAARVGRHMFPPAVIETAIKKAKVKKAVAQRIFPPDEDKDGEEDEDPELVVDDAAEDEPAELIDDGDEDEPPAPPVNAGRPPTPPPMPKRPAAKKPAKKPAKKKAAKKKSGGKKK